MEWHITDDGKYRIESMTPATFHGALRAMKLSFCQDEALAIGAEVNKNPKAIEEILEVCAIASLDGVSLVAVDVNTKEVVAVAFNKIHIKPLDPTEKPFFELHASKCTQDSSRSFLKYMGDVVEKCNLWEKYNVNCSFEILFLSTFREHREQKLGTLLCKYAIEVARKVKDGPIAPINVEDLGPEYSHLKNSKSIDKYPKICQAVFTGRGSQKIGKNLNFTVHLTEPYTKAVFNGKTYAERLGEISTICQVVALSLY